MGGGSVPGRNGGRAAYSPASKGERAGIVTCGSAYRCCRIAERAIVEAGLPLTRLPMTPYPELGAALTRHLARLAISSDLVPPLERLTGWLARPEAPRAHGHAAARLARERHT